MHVTYISKQKERCLRRTFLHFLQEICCLNLFNKRIHPLFAVQAVRNGVFFLKVLPFNFSLPFCIVGLFWAPVWCVFEFGENPLHPRRLPWMFFFFFCETSKLRFFSVCFVVPVRAARVVCFTPRRLLWYFLPFHIWFWVGTHCRLSGFWPFKQKEPGMNATPHWNVRRFTNHGNKVGSKTHKTGSVLRESHSLSTKHWFFFLQQIKFKGHTFECFCCVLLF